MEVKGTSSDATPLPPAVTQPSLDPPGASAAAGPLAPWTSAGRTLGEHTPMPSQHPSLDDVEQWDAYGETAHDEIEPGSAGSEVVPWTVVDAPQDESSWSATPVEEATLELEDHHIAEGETDVALHTRQPAQDAFPWDDTASGDPSKLSPWEALGRAVKESVSWSDLAGAPPVAETWELTPEDRVEPPSGSWTAGATTVGVADEGDIYAQLALRLEKFAEEMRLHGHAAISRALAGDRLEAALASLIAGYVAAARND
jgi:hypothetical protein